MECDLHLYFFKLHNRTINPSKRGCLHVYINPQGELIHLVGHFKNYVENQESGKKKCKTGAAHTCAKQETSEVILTKKSCIQKTEKK